MSDPDAGTIPNCTSCHHKWHGFPCVVCPCPTAFIEPNLEETA